jgi:membrane associated rhomboid family serine protease
MNNPFRSLFAVLPVGPRSILLLYLLGYPIALLGHYTHQFNPYAWLALSPASVWQGQVWRMVTYAILPGGIVDWVVSLFWLATLLSVLGRNWSARGLWGYWLLATGIGALPVVLLEPKMEAGFAGNSAAIFALLFAWDRLYRRERLILLGWGEISVRQAAVLVGIIEGLVLLFSCGGWIFMPAMLCGGLGGWLYLFACHKRLMGGNAGPVRSERVARLEL